MPAFSDSSALYKHHYTIAPLDRFTTIWLCLGPSCLVYWHRLMHPEDGHGHTPKARNSRSCTRNWLNEASRIRHPLITRRCHIIRRHLARIWHPLRARQMAGLRPSSLQGQRPSLPPTLRCSLHPASVPPLNMQLSGILVDVAAVSAVQRLNSMLRQPHQMNRMRQPPTCQPRFR